jgi:integrase
MMARIAKLQIRKLKNGRWIIEEPTELHDGERVQSTFASKPKAEKRLAELKAMKSNFGGSLATMSPPRIAEASEAYKKLDASKLKVSLLTVVESYLAEHGRRNQSISLEALFEQYLAIKEKAHPKYISDIRQTLNKFSALKQTTVSDITTDNVEMALAGVSAGARNNALKNVRTIFNYAMDRGYAQDNPVKKTSFADRAKSKREIIPVEKVQMILEYALENSPEIVPYLAILFFTGVRPEDEAMSLKWSDINGKNVLWVSETKIGDGREIPLSKNAIAWINAAKARYSFVTEKIMSLSHYQLSVRRQAAYGVAGYSKIPQDAARHSFASYWLPVNKSNFGQLLVYMGHTTIKVLQAHYRRHASEEDAKRYWQIMPPVNRPT